MHLLVGTQRPDAYILDGEIRAQFTTRLSTGSLDREGAVMMWRSPWVGTAPVSAPGRGVAATGSEDPFDVQVYWTPDPRRIGELTSASAVEERAILASLRPQAAVHEPMRPVFNPDDDEADLTWDDVADARWDLDRRELPAYAREIGADQAPLPASDSAASPLPPAADPEPLQPARLEVLPDDGIEDEEGR